MTVRGGWAGDAWDEAACGLLTTGADGVVTAANATVAGLIGVPAAHLVGRRLVDLLTSGARLFWLAHWAPSLALAGGLTGVRVDLAGQDGRRPVVLDCRVGAGGTLHVAVVDARGRDLAERRLAAARTEAATTRAWARAVLTATPDPVAVVDDEGRVTAWNPAAQRVLGRPADEAVGADLAHLLAGGDPGRARRLRELLRGPLEGPAPSREPVDVVRRDGRVLTVDAWVGRAADDGHLVTTVQLRDRTMFAAPVDASDGPSHVLVLGIDRHGVYDVVEGSGQAVAGAGAAGLVGRHVDEVLADQPEALDAVRRALAGEAFTVATRFAGRDWDVAYRPRRGGGGTPAGATVVATDVTAHRSMSAELELRTRTDPLTGLANRVGLQAALAAATTRPARAAVLFLDLDGFKDVNDSLGHAVGDEVLVEVARRLVAGAPVGATVARHGGDEFVVVLGPEVPDQPDLAARRLLRRLAAPLVLTTGARLAVRASVGISRRPEDAAGAEELLAHADAAMYRAKAGRCEVATYDAAKDDASDRLLLLDRLRLALDEGGLDVHYQPVVRLGDGRVTSAEALVRWTDDVLGVVSPARLVEVAESGRLVDALGRHVLDRACADLARWDAAGVRLDRVAVNVSPLQRTDGRLPAHVAASLARHGIGADRLVLELTESAVVGLDDGGLGDLRRLRAQGVRVALDDFGTGTSSLARLRDLPVDVVKVDRSFVEGLPAPVPLALVRAVVGVAAALGLETVAEGVETRAQADCVRAAGCTSGQGWLYGRPVPADRLSVQKLLCGLAT